MKRHAIIAMFVLAACAASLGAGAIEYPLPGHFEHEEGTIELWFTPTIDLAPVPDVKYESLIPLLSIEVPEGFRLGGGCFSRGGQLMFGFSMSHPELRGALLPVNGQVKRALPAGKALHIALTWRGNIMQLYLDGECIGSRRQGARLSGTLVGRTLRIGGQRDARMVLHAVRLSCVAREEALLQDAQPVADTLTLLLDRFDSPDHVSADGRTAAQVISGLSGETGGVIHGHWHFVDDPVPGVALAPQPNP